ncbi:MAG: penicillin-binding transpeptidase domain-containing protein, partial [Bdellovibrionota bacterium]
DLVDGLWLVRESQRVYPHGSLAAHLIGDVNVDSEGLEGSELWFNDRLKGKLVSVAAIKDALGRPTFIDAAAATQVQDGEPVTLTIDNSLQYSVEEQLRAAVHRTGARSGTVIAMNAANGEVLAMANEPSFNPNEKGAGPDRRRNRAVTDGYEPGSTMKAVLLATALSKGMHLTDQIWGERGKFRVQGKRIAEAEAKDKFEWLSLKKIVQVSSNVGAAKLALKVGADSYLQMIKNMGFSARTGLGFPGEIPGRVPGRREWQPLTLANIGFGQGILVTPIQMLRAYATFVNGGWLVQPTLLKTDGIGKKPETPHRVITAKVASEVIQALELVTQEGGTGVKAALPGYVVAGKTGTAQVVEPGGHGYSRTKHIASFIGFPVGVEPKIVILAVLDEPKGVYFAAETAAPLFREVLAAVTNRFSIPATQDLPRKLAQSAPRGSKLRDSIHSTQAAQAHPAALEPAKLDWQGSTGSGALVWKMPSLKGLTPREAMVVLKGHPFQVEVRGSGLISTQVPEEGRAVADGEIVRLGLSEP